MVLVDAHNVLFRARSSRKAAGWDLLALALALHERRLFRREVMLVCDGDPPRGLLGAWSARIAEAGPEATSRGEPVSFHFSGGEVEADDVIEGLLASSLRPRGMLVVSSDRRLREAARLHKAEHMPSNALVSWLTRPGRMEERPAFAEAVPLTRLEVESWLQQLGIDAQGRPTQTQPALKKPETRARGASALPRDALAAPRPRPASEARPARLDVHPDELPHVDMEHWLRLFPPSSQGKQK